MRFFLTGFVMAVFFLSPIFVPASFAQEESVKINATILVASNDGTDYDLDNDAYRHELINLFSYSAYHQIRMVSLTLPRAERVKVPLPENYELILTLQGKEEKRVMVQAVIRKGQEQYVDTVLSILKPGVVFVGGPPTAVGAYIIVLETAF